MRKKSLVACLLLMAVLASAEDALVPPPGSLMITTAVTVGWSPGIYDVNGAFQQYNSGDGNWTFLNLSLALELGLSDWISAGVVWAPGANLWSQTDLKVAPIFDFTKANVNVPYDPLVGFKLQLIGPKAPYASDKVRLAVAPGVKIPLPAPDMYSESNKYIDGKEFLISDPELRAFGVGAALYADLILNESAFLNFYFQHMQFAPVKKNAEFNPVAPVNVKISYDYLYLDTVEIEPHYRMPLGSAMKLGASLPLRARLQADYSKDGAIQTGSGYFLMNLEPKLVLLLTGTPIPLEFKLGYEFSVMGLNRGAQRMLTLLMRPLLKVF